MPIFESLEMETCDGYCLHRNSKVVVLAPKVGIGSQRKLCDTMKEEILTIISIPLDESG